MKRIALILCVILGVVLLTFLGSYAAARRAANEIMAPAVQSGVTAYHSTHLKSGWFHRSLLSWRVCYAPAGDEGFAVTVSFFGKVRGTVPPDLRKLARRQHKGLSNKTIKETSS
jgi:hypothetical protein